MKKILSKFFKKKEKKHYYPTDVWSEVTDKYKLKEKLWHYVKVRASVDKIEAGIVIYGEIYGPGIQQNYDYGLKELEFAVFDITYNNKYDSVIHTEYVVKNVLRLPHVPILYIGPWSQKVQDKHVFNNMIEGTKVPHEGIVIKHVSGERQKVAKVINPDYLIASEKHDYGDSH
jgi:ATP-dependent RNA circularization protein (DNA/RNA ligase family)